MTKYWFSFLLLFPAIAVSEVLKSSEQFIEEAFESSPKREVLWLNQEIKAQVRKEIDYQLNQLRVRYWAQGSRTAWILEEVGKEEVITIGVVVDNDKIEHFNVLVYRESRGGEIKHSFFTKQFIGAGLKLARNKMGLSERIDGITGATLSVRATKKVATLALFLHQQTDYATHVEKK